MSISTSRRRSAGAGRGAGRLRLAGRQLRHDPGVSVMLAVLVLVITMVALLMPRIVSDINSRQVPYVISTLSTTQRDISATGNQNSLTARRDNPPAQGASAIWSATQRNLALAREAQPEPLRSLMGEGEFFLEVGDRATTLGCGGIGTCIDPLPPGTEITLLELTPRIDPAIADHIEMVRGDEPEPVINFGSDPGQNDGGPGQIQIMLPDATATALAWEVGEDVGAFRLTGTFRPLDPAAARWQHAPNSIELGETFDGNIGLIGHAAGYLAPGSSGHIYSINTNLRFRYFFPLDASDLRAEQVETVAAQLTSLASTSFEMTPPPSNSTGYIATVSVNFSSEAVDDFRSLLDQQRATNAILAVVAAGPIGLTLAVFALGARLIITRRQKSLSLAAARGGSLAQLRSLLFAEGLLLGVPAALLGWWWAGRVLPPVHPWQEWVLAGLVALVPALALALSPAQTSLRESRRDLGARSRSAIRWVAEVAVVGLAALAVWQLWQRGIDPGSSGGPDLVVSATPVLLCLAVCVLTLRLYPLPMRALVSLLRRRRGLTGFLGASRAVRDTVGGLVPALALVLGTAVLVSSVVLANTIDRGTVAAAWQDTGSQVRVTGARMLPEVVDQLRSAPGVAQVATVAIPTRGVALTGAATVPNVSVIVVDDDLPEVYAATGEVSPLPDELFDSGSPVPVLSGGTVSADTGTGQLGGVGTVRFLDHLDTGLAGVRSPRAFVVISRSNFEAAGQSVPLSTLALLSVQPNADAAEVSAELNRRVPTGLIQTTETVLDQFRDSPVNAGLNRIFVLAAGATFGLTVLAVLLVHLMGTPARVRLLSVLRTIGLPPGQGRALAGWEMGPLVAASFVAGTAAGVGIPWLLLRAVGMAELTGGSVQPTLVLDPWWVTATLLALLFVVAVTVLIASSAASRTNLAQQMRIGEER